MWRYDGPALTIGIALQFREADVAVYLVHEIGWHYDRITLALRAHRKFVLRHPNL
jgi:hypothetical protein